MSQNWVVFLLNVRPSPGIPFWVCLLNSHFKNIFNCFYELSILGVWIPEQFLQYHLWDPDLFFPYLIQILLQTGQITCFIYLPSKYIVFIAFFCPGGLTSIVKLQIFIIVNILIHWKILRIIYSHIHHSSPIATLCYILLWDFLALAFALTSKEGKSQLVCNRIKR